MAQLYFYYSTMNAGKSTNLLQAAHNYKERGMSVTLLTYGGDDRSGTGKIKSRVGIETEALSFYENTDLKKLLCLERQYKLLMPVHCILIDESQFLTKSQVDQLSRIIRINEIPIMCYGLRTDFRGNLFPGSKRLFEVADKLIEVKSICFCGKKATQVVRHDSSGKVETEGQVVEIGGEEKYTSLCRLHAEEARLNRMLPSEF